MCRNGLFINFIIFYVALSLANAQNYTNYDENYGKTWMYFPDGDGVPQVVYLTESQMGSTRSLTVKSRTNFELYTRQARKPKVMQLRKKRDVSLDEFNKLSDPNKETKIIIHGWRSSTNSDTVQHIKDAYLQKYDVNVIAVDWASVASNFYYFTPATQTKDVGRYVSELIYYLITDRGTDVNKIHIIGHSLGAHAAGYAGHQWNPVLTKTKLKPHVSAVTLKSIDDYVNNQLYLGMESAFRNTTIKDCVWHRTYDGNCSRSVSLILYVGNKREVFDPSDRNWLQKRLWDQYKATVVLVHGYASGDNDTPIVVLKDAYATQGGYNLFLVEYSQLSRPPCFVSTLNNVQYISRCLADYLNDLRREGVVVESCIGHSLGAIICGALQKYLQFELNKIIGLDPALPLIYGDLRLKRSSAKSVHVLQTNAGSFGDVGSVGHVNVCVNGGLMQPYCLKTRKPNLCSHIWAVCYMAQSLFGDRPLMAKSCSTYCPKAGLFRFFRSNSSENNFNEIQVINNVPDTAYGTYCLDNIYPPYCPKYWNGVGDKRCCKFR